VDKITGGAHNWLLTFSLYYLGERVMMMKGQWGLLFAILFALIIALFSVFNVDPVTVNYLFGEARWSLILVILGSVLMGGLMVGSIGLVRVFRLQRTVKRLERELETLRGDSVHASLTENNGAPKETFNGTKGNLNDPTEGHDD
jgi:lipopolysaccharide assembly protein A